MSIYSDKLSRSQVVIKCLHSIAQMCTREDVLAYISGAPSIDDVMSYNSLTTIYLKSCTFSQCFAVQVILVEQGGVIFCKNNCKGNTRFESMTRNVRYWYPACTNYLTNYISLPKLSKYLWVVDN